MKLKEYVLATSDFSSAGDVDLLFDGEPWGSPAASIWASARDYFAKHKDDVVGITMTMDSPRVFWRAYIKQGVESCSYEEITPFGKPSLGLLSIRVHLEHEGENRHRNHLEKMNFIQDDRGYWSHNIWSE